MRRLENLKNNLWAFNLEVDMGNPTFRFGMVFSDGEEVRKAV
jgi:hypothetical protein